MPEADKEYEMIIKYLDGDLNEEEQLAFNQLMNSSEEFRKELRNTEEIIASLKVSDRVDRFRMVKETFAEFESEYGRQVKNWSKGVYWLSGLAASFALLIVGYIYFFADAEQSRSQEIFAQYYEAFPIDQGSIRNEEANLNLGLQLYMKGQYSEAIPHLEALVEHDSATANFIYLSNAYLATKEFAQAEELLKNLDSESQNTVMSRYRKWYLCLALLAQDKINEAKAELSGLAETSGIYQEESQEIMDRL